MTRKRPSGLRCCPFEPMQLVKASLGQPAWDYPWKAGDIVLFLGEIKQMPGHCAVATHDGKVHWGYHTFDFTEPTEDEI